MPRKLDDIHHIALQVTDIAAAVDWYCNNFECDIAYQDETWALLKFQNTAIALVVPNQHPPHIGVIKDDLKKYGTPVAHRDGTSSVYVNDPDGNTLEMLHTPDDHTAYGPTREDVLAVQKLWADGIVAIGKAFKEGGDYKQVASDHIHTLYAYDTGPVLFKPTLASADQFRDTFEKALSYFVGGIVPEDKGFAIRPWSKVRFGEQEIMSLSTTAFAMGNYYFTPADGGSEQKVEFTFGYTRDKHGHLRIYLHHSSLPYDES